MTGQSLAGKIALITGASRGIGAAIAKKYAAAGAHLILVARSKNDLEQVDDEIQKDGFEAATLVPLDLKDGDKIDQLGAVIADRFGKLDILVGNAGILGSLTPVNHIDPKSWNDVMTINATANYRLLRSFDALLRNSENGKAIFVTSGATARPHPYWGAYAASKAALESIVETYAAEVTHTNLSVHLADPGRVRTHMRAQAIPGEDPMTIPSANDSVDIFLELATAGNDLPIKIINNAT
jgi:NAD(P)-dependent dehydrogenase (short-subunit alcohol dehydrogenase family)